MKFDAVLLGSIALGVLPGEWTRPRSHCKDGLF